MTHTHRRSAEDLRIASNWLIYEIWMFRGLANEIRYGKHSGLGVVSNAILDSFLIRIRALLDFLYPHNPHPDDVLAEDYFSSPSEWAEIRPEVDRSFLIQLRKKISQSVAHISHARQRHSWEWQEIFEVIDPAIDLFLSVVSRDLLGSRWEPFKQENRNDENGILPLPPFLEGCNWEEILTSFYVSPSQIETDRYP